MHIRTFASEDTKAVIQLWQDCGLTRPWNDPHLDIQRKMNFQPDLFYVGVLKQQIIASAMFGYDGHRGWLNYLGVTPKHRGQGYSARLISHGCAALKQLGCPKLNLQLRTENSRLGHFYQDLGFTKDDCSSYGIRLISDSDPAS